MSKLLQKNDSRLYFRFIHNTELKGWINDDKLKAILIQLGYIKAGDPGKYIELKKLWPREKVIQEIKDNL